MRFLFLNQYAPPDSPPTARLLGDLAGHLRAHGHEVTILSQRQTYEGRPARGVSRLRRELAALVAIAGAGLRLGRSQVDVVLALSSPPGLLVVAALLARWQRARLVHWAMDLYPELALALGEIGAGPVFRLVRAAMRRAYRRTDLLVVLDEDMGDRLRGFARRIRVLAPWPSIDLPEPFPVTAPTPADAPWTWLYSGNLGRAHEWQTLLDAQRLLETRDCPVRLVFQGDGAARQEAEAYADRLNLRHCAWTGYVAESELIPGLLAAQVLIVTQRPETRGLLWPSKLALLEQLPRPILYIGCTDGAISGQLAKHGSAGIFAPGQAEAVADWVESCYRGTAKSWDGRSGGDVVRQNSREEGCRLLEQWLSEAVT